MIFSNTIKPNTLRKHAKKCFNQVLRTESAIDLIENTDKLIKSYGERDDHKMNSVEYNLYMSIIMNRNIDIAIMHHEEDLSGLLSRYVSSKDFSMLKAPNNTLVTFRSVSPLTGCSLPITLLADSSTCLDNALRGLAYRLLLSRYEAMLELTGEYPIVSFNISADDIKNTKYSSLATLRLVREFKLAESLLNDVEYSSLLVFSSASLLGVVLPDSPEDLTTEGVISRIDNRSVELTRLAIEYVNVSTSKIN